jgi:hypothetical protein
MSEKAPTSSVDLKAVKSLAKMEFSGMDGVEGIGIGEQCLRIYVRNHAVQQTLPIKFHGIPIEFVITGSVAAFHGN